MGRWVHNSVSFQARQESAPVHSPFPLFLPAVQEKTPCTSPAGAAAHSVLPLKCPSMGFPALPSGTWTLKHEVEECLSLLSAALHGSSFGEDGPEGSGPCAWGSPQPREANLVSPHFFLFKRALNLLLMLFCPLYFEYIF